MRRRCTSRAWFTYSLLLLVLVLTVFQTSSYLSYAESVAAGNTHNVLYGLFRPFFEHSSNMCLGI